MFMYVLDWCGDVYALSECSMQTHIPMHIHTYIHIHAYTDAMQAQPRSTLLSRCSHDQLTTTNPLTPSPTHHQLTLTPTINTHTNTPTTPSHILVHACKHTYPCTYTHNKTHTHTCEHKLNTNTQIRTSITQVSVMMDALMYILVQYMHYALHT